MRWRRYFARVCLKNTGGVENSRFWVLYKCAFEGNIGLYCPKKTCWTGSESCILGAGMYFSDTPWIRLLTALSARWEYHFQPVRPEA